MALQGFHSPESTVSSLLASSGHLDPDPGPSTIRYRDRDFGSASAALDAYIADFDRWDINTSSTGRLQLPRGPVPVRSGIRNKDVLHEQLTERELDFLSLPASVRHRQRDADLLSLTTDDLLVLPCDGSLPVTRTSAFLSLSGRRSGSATPGAWSSSRTRPLPGSGHAPCARHPAPHRPLPPGGGGAGRTLNPDAGAKGRHHHHHRHHRHHHDLTSVLAETHRPEAASPRHYPRWMTSQKSEMDFSGVSSVPDITYPSWLLECGLPADAATAGVKPRAGGRTLPPSPRCPSWLGDLEASYQELQREAGGAVCDPGDGGGEPVGGARALRRLRMQFAERLGVAAEVDGGAGLENLFREDKIEGLILKAEKVLTSPSLGLGRPQTDPASPGSTEDGLEAERSWDNPPVTFKSPVPVGGAEDPDTADGERKEEATLASCSSGYSSRKHPGPVEALKQMLFSLQAVEQRFSPEQPDGPGHAHNPATHNQDTGTELEDHSTAPGGQSLERALHHLQRLKTLVEVTKDHTETQEGKDSYRRT